MYVNRAYVFAEQKVETEIGNDLNENINSQINSLDTSELDNLLQEVLNDSSILNGASFTQKIKDIINGKLTIDAGTFSN